MFITLIETAQIFQSSELCIDSAIADGLLRNRYKVSTNSSQSLQQVKSQLPQDVSRLETFKLLDDVLPRQDVDVSFPKDVRITIDFCMHELSSNHLRTFDGCIKSTFQDCVDIILRNYLFEI